MRNISTCEDFAAARQPHGDATTAPSIWRRLWAALTTAYERWMKAQRDRRALSDLAKLSDAALRDIGVTRDDVEWAARMPSTSDASAALQVRALERTLSNF